MREHIKKAASMANSWGYYATIRYLQKRTGCNRNTAIYCISLAQVLEGGESGNHNKRTFLWLPN